MCPVSTEPRGRELIDLALEGEPFLRQRGLDHRDRLVEHQFALRLVVRIGLGIEVARLEPVIAPAEPDLDAPAGQLVEQRDILGRAQRVPERDDCSSEADPDALRPCREVHRGHHRIGQQFAPPDAEMVFRHPQHVEVRLVADRCQLAQLVEQVAVIALLGQVVQIMKQAELHAVSPLSRARFGGGRQLVWYTILGNGETDQPRPPGQARRQERDGLGRCSG